jgi:glycosyltransferase involved in cell wall biosynthesis
MKVKEDILIADVIGSYNAASGTASGPWYRLFENYKDALKEDFNVHFAGSKRYVEMFNQVSNNVVLKYEVKAGHKNRFGSLLSKYKQMMNIIYVLRSNFGKVLFQECSLLPLFLVLMFYSGNKKVYCMLYGDFNHRKGLKKFILRMLFRFAQRNIHGYILSRVPSKGSFRHFMVAPDFLPEEENLTSLYEKKLNSLYEHDFLVVGIIDERKDVERLIEVIKKTKFKLCIVGRFNRDELYKRCVNSAGGSDNIRIVNEYLSDAVLKEFIMRSRFVVLPYQRDYYLKRTSGVLYNALFYFTPIIAPNLGLFRELSEKSIVLTYDNLGEIPALVEQLTGDDYARLIQRIWDFVLELSGIKKELVEFLRTN